MSHNAKYYVKSLKRNKLKSSDIKELWKKKKDVVEEPVNTEENIDSLDTLTDTATADFGCASSSSQSKRQCYQGRLIICLFSLCYIVQFC